MLFLYIICYSAAMQRTWDMRPTPRAYSPFKPEWQAILERYDKKYHEEYQEETKDMGDMGEMGDVPDA